MWSDGKLRTSQWCAIACDGACSHLVQLRQGESSDRSTLIESITLDGLTKGDLLTATVSINVDGKIHCVVYTIHGAVMLVVLWLCGALV